MFSFVWCPDVPPGWNKDKTVEADSPQIPGVAMIDFGFSSLFNLLAIVRGETTIQ